MGEGYGEEGRKLGMLGEGRKNPVGKLTAGQSMTIQVRGRNECR